jgi:hypothetical protein
MQTKDCVGRLYKVKAIFDMLTDKLQSFYIAKRETRWQQEPMTLSAPLHNAPLQDQ